jgi:peptidoglycan/xylan/chitin deacetylase (PgdA/CDA1 family)
MRIAIPRRAVLGAALAAAAAAIAGCTRRPDSSAGAPTSPAIRTSAIRTSAGLSANSEQPTNAVPSNPARGPSPTGAVGTAPARPAVSSPGPPPIAATRTPAPPRTTAPPRPTAAVRPFGPATQVDRGPSHGSMVALTFHGAGDIDMARQILRIAAAKRARITVMAVGTWLDLNPGIARTILAGAHELGNHTWSHLDINALPEEQMRQEVVRCRDALLRHAGVPGAYFRQSQSQNATERMRTVAGAAGYRTCLSYDLDSMDWTDPGPAVVRTNLRAAAAGSIVSLHLGHRGTVEALPGIMDDLAARGLHPVTVSRLLAG